MICCFIGQKANQPVVVVELINFFLLSPELDAIAWCPRKCFVPTSWDIFVQTHWSRYLIGLGSRYGPPSDVMLMVKDDCVMSSSYVRITTALIGNPIQELPSLRLWVAKVLLQWKDRCAGVIVGKLSFLPREQRIYRMKWGWPSPPRIEACT